MACCVLSRHVVPTRHALLVAGGAIFLGPAGALHPLPTLCALILVAGILRRHWRMAAFAIVLAGLSAWRATRRLDEFERQRTTVRDAIGGPSRCSGQARVVRSPVVTGGTTRLTVEFGSVDCERGPLPGPLLARVYGGPSSVVRGDELELVAQLAPVRHFRNEGLMDPLPRAARVGVVVSGQVLAATPLSRGYGWRAVVDRARQHARARIQRTFAPLTVPMARALVLGENDLEPGDDEAFRRSGLAHLLAVSGTHLVVAVLAFLAVLRGFLVRLEFIAARWDVSRLVAGIGAPLALLYADYAGGSGSAWRAAFMLACLCLAQCLHRKPDGTLALGASLALGGLLDPLALYDLSFSLSVAATAGLLWLARPFGKRLRSIPWSWLRWLLMSLLVTTSAMLPCAPLLALLGPTITIAGLLANLVAAPIGEMAALPLCLLHALLEPFPPLERGVALVGSGALACVRYVAHVSAGVEALALSVPDPTAWHFAVLAVGIAGGARFSGTRPRLLACGLTVLALVAVERQVRASQAKSGVMRVTVLDVGQGDSLIVDMPDGRVLLVDGGGFVGSPVDPGKQVVLPMLRARRRSHIDVVVLTHPHPDHIGGVVSVLQSAPVREVWLGTSAQGKLLGPGFERLVASGTRLLTANDLCGKVRAFGGARVRVLAPCPAVDGGRTANDNSLVLRLELGGYTALLVGDAEHGEERVLLEQSSALLPAQLLKVGHHGSRTSSGADFVEAVSPELAFVSCGVRNRFGHPHAEALATLSRNGVTVRRTDRQGSLSWSTDGLRSWVSAYSEPR